MKAYAFKKDGNKELEESVLNWKNNSISIINSEYGEKGPIIFKSILETIVTINSFAGVERFLISRKLPILSREQIVFIWKEKWEKGEESLIFRIDLKKNKLIL